MKKLITLIILQFTSYANATIDVLLDVKYASEGVQHSGYCLQNRTMIANVGILPLSVVKGAFKPVMIYDEGRFDKIEQINFNILSKAKIEYINDTFDENDVLTFEVNLDVSKLVANESIIKAVSLVKLAIIVLNKNILSINDKYNLTIHIKGMPEQDQTTGLKVYTETKSPYSSSSSIVADYIKELDVLLSNNEINNCF